MLLRFAALDARPAITYLPLMVNRLLLALLALVAGLSAQTAPGETRERASATASISCAARVASCATIDHCPVQQRASGASGSERTSKVCEAPVYGLANEAVLIGTDRAHE